MLIRMSAVFIAVAKQHPLPPFRPGQLIISLGTSATLFGVSDRPILDPTGSIAPFCDATGAWLPLVCLLNCTSVLSEVCASGPYWPMDSLVKS